MLRQLRNASLDRGLFQGNRPWLVLGAVLWAARAAKVAWAKDDGVVWQGVLTPGETVQVTYRPPVRRRSRRAS